MEWWSLLELDYTIWIKHSYSGHHYVLQNVLILKAFHMTFFTVEQSNPFVGNPAPTVNRHMTTVCVGRHILRVVMLSPQSVN
jgi:hypothetical protein